MSPNNEQKTPDLEKPKISSQIAVFLDELEASETALRGKASTDTGEDPYDILPYHLMGVYARPKWVEVAPTEGILLPLERAYLTGQLCFRFQLKDLTELFITVSYSAEFGPPSLDVNVPVEIHHRAKETIQIPSSCITPQLCTVLDLLVLVSGIG